MNAERSLKRREFLSKFSAAVAAGLAGNPARKSLFRGENGSPGDHEDEEGA